MVQIKRVYEAPAEADGFRILVDRLWPRGVSKDRAAIDLWFKEISPSPELRTWFGHEPERFEAFRHKYLDELTDSPAVDKLVHLTSEHPTITLLYAAKDTANNHAVVLKELLDTKL